MGIPVAQWWRIPLPMREMCVWSRGWKDPLEKKMASHSSILAWEIPWTEKPGGLQSRGLQKSQTWFSNKTTTTNKYNIYQLAKKKPIFLFIFGHTPRHVGPSCPHQESNLCLLHRKAVLTIGPLGSPKRFF